MIQVTTIKHIFDTRQWASMTMFEQMGSIGSEVGRALSAKHRSDAVSMNGALARGLDLIDTTASLWAAQKSPRTKELLLAREQFTKSILTDEEDLTLEAYFFQYAYAARKDR